MPIGIGSTSMSCFHCFETQPGPQSLCVSTWSGRISHSTSPCLSSELLPLHLSSRSFRTRPLPILLPLPCLRERQPDRPVRVQVLDQRKGLPPPYYPFPLWKGLHLCSR